MSRERLAEAIHLVLTESLAHQAMTGDESLEAVVRSVMVPVCQTVEQTRREGVEEGLGLLQMARDRGLEMRYTRVRNAALIDALKAIQAAERDIDAAWLAVEDMIKEMDK